MALNENYIQYLGESIEELSKKDSLMKSQKIEMISYFDKFALTSEQIADIITKTLTAETQYLNQYATAGAAQLVKLDLEKEIADAQMAKTLAEIALIIKQGEKLDKEMELVDTQILKVTAEIKVMDAEVLKIGAESSRIAAETSEITARAGLVGSQQSLVDRQVTGYGDNMMAKAGEYQGGLASFAVNSASEDAQDAIDAFLVTIGEMKARAT